MPFIMLLWPSYYFCCCCCFLCVIEIATKNDLWHCSCCHRYLDKQNKTYQRLHKNRVHMDFFWKSARYVQCHLPWSWYYISNMAAHVMLSCILIQNNSYLLELNREFFDDLWLKWNSYSKSKNYIRWPVSLMIIVIKFIQMDLLFIWYFG